MDTFLIVAGVLLFLTCYGWLAAVAWQVLTLRHIAWLRSGTPFPAKQGLYVLALHGPLVILPPAAFFLASRCMHLKTTTFELFLLVSARMLSIVPGARRAHRLMRAAGIDPDAG